MKYDFAEGDTVLVSYYDSGKRITEKGYVGSKYENRIWFEDDMYLCIAMALHIQPIQVLLIEKAYIEYNEE